MYLLLICLLQNGVKWVILGSDPQGLPGVAAGVSSNATGTLSLAPEFYNYAQPLRTSVMVDTSYLYVFLFSSLFPLQIVH
jgi:hypothetical protein